MNTLPAQERRPRNDWMDVFRGVAIVLVVLWHAPAVPVLLGYEMPDWLRALNNAFLPFRMPGLMFLSGLLLHRSLDKPWRTYTWGKLRGIAWPYAIWAGLHIATFGSPNEWYSWRAWWATGYLWFLFFILLYYAIAPLLRRLPPWLTVLAPLVLASFMPPSKEQRLVYFAVFFFAGYVVTSYPRLLERLLHRWLLPLYAVAAVAGGVLSSVRGVTSAYHPELAWASLSGVLVLIAAARYVQHARWVAPLRSVGRNSIVYYVSHFPLIHLTTVVLAGLGVTSIGPVVVVGLVTALAGGWALTVLRQHSPVRWLFEAPDLPALWTRTTGSNLRQGR